MKIMKCPKCGATRDLIQSPTDVFKYLCFYCGHYWSEAKEGTDQGGHK